RSAERVSRPRAGSREPRAEFLSRRSDGGGAGVDGVGGGRLHPTRQGRAGKAARRDPRSGPPGGTLRTGMGGGGSGGTRQRRQPAGVGSLSRSPARRRDTVLRRLVARVHEAGSTEKARRRLMWGT